MGQRKGDEPRRRDEVLAAQCALHDKADLFSKGFTVAGGGNRKERDRVEKTEPKANLKVCY